MLPDSSEVTNLQFEARISRLIPAAVRTNAFYAKVAGGSHTNPDGTSHAAVIKKCKTFDILRLEVKSENPFAANAVAVFSETGEQMGYLDSGLTRGAQWNVARWIAIFRHQKRDSETGAVVGAIVYMIHLTELFARQRETKLARAQCTFS
jgi:hypothetical protein